MAHALRNGFFKYYHQGYYLPDAEVAEKLINKIQEELNPNQIRLERGLAMLMIVGDAIACNRCNLKSINGSEPSGINIEIINRGISEISTLFGIKKEFF